MNYSLTYVGAIAGLITALGILDANEALELTTAVALIFTTVVTLYGRWKAGGVNILGNK